MTVTVYLTPTGKPAGIPPCCTCDRAVCAADTTGEHCEARGCGTCLHGCPAPAGQPCCLDSRDGEQWPTRPANTDTKKEVAA